MICCAPEWFEAARLDVVKEQMTQVHVQSKRPILVIGTSHTSAISAGLTIDQRDRVDVVNIATFFDPEGGRNKILHPELTELFVPEHIFCTFGGSEHNVLGLIEAPQPFDFYAPGLPELGEGRVIIPRSLVRADLKRRMRRWLELSRSLQAMFPRPIHHLCSPPPFREIDQNAVLPTVFDDILARGIAPAALRWKLHDLHSEIARAHCDEIGIGFIPPPPTAMDAEGFLLTGLWKKDPTHGNAAYGTLAMGQVMEVLHV